MNKIIIFGTSALALLITVLILSTCSNPLTAGLGDKVDLEDPQLEITSHHNGDSVGSIFDLAGTVTDDGVVESVIISLNSEGNVIGSASITDSSWNFSFDSTALADGDYEFLVVATDNTDKSVSRKVLLTVDNNPPSILVTSPSEYGTAVDDPEFNKSITIKGEAADTTRVKEVLISLYRSSDDLAVFTDEKSTGTSSWYYIFDSSILDGGLPLIGNYYFFVKAIDYSGNENTYFYHFEDILGIAIDKSATPNVEEINAVDFQGADPATLGLGDLLTDLRLPGIPGKMEIKIDPDSDQPQFTIINPAEGSVLPSENVFSSPQRLSGFVEDDDLAGIDEATLIITITNWGTGTVIESTTYDGINPLFTLSGNTWTYESNLVDGEYGVELTVDDASGNTGTSSLVPFKVSSFAPLVTITKPVQGSYIGAGSTTTIEVEVTGMGGTGTVELDPNGDNNFADAILMSNTHDSIPIGDQGGNIYAVYIIDGAAGFTVVDGDRYLKFQAGTIDNYGNASLQYTGDTINPTVSITYPPDSANVNGAINISGTASDYYPIDKVYIWVGTETDPLALPTDYENATLNWNDAITNTEWIIPIGTYNWSISNFDTNILTDSTSYTIFVKSFDAAGNGSNLSAPESSLSFIVNQESDRPVISLSNMVEGGSSNGLAQDASIIGLIEDDDLVDASSVEVRIDIYNDGSFLGEDLSNPLDDDTSDTNETESWVSVLPGATGADDVRILSWIYNLLNVPQGVHSMQIRVHDTISDGVTFDEGTNPNYAELLITEFIIDYGPPDLVITSPSSGTIFNADFTIEGTATDPNNVTDVEISFDAGTTYLSLYSDPTGLGVVNWTYNFTIDPTGADDGDYSYLIQATDSSGGKTTLNRQVVVDASDPTVIIELPGAGSIVNGDNVTIRGTANDNAQVSKVYLAQGTSLPAAPAGGDPAADIAYTELGSTYTWSYDLDSTFVHNADSDQSYFISIVAVDGAGNLSSKEDLNFTINQGSDRPVISFNDIDKDETVAVNNVLVGATTLTGIIEDDDLIDPDQPLFPGNAIEISIDGAAWIPVSVQPPASGKFVVWRHDISALLEGEHLVKVRARDDQSDGTVGDSSIDIEYTNNFNWNIAENADPVTEPNGIPFILNLGPPTIIITNPANYSYHNSTVTIDGTSFDANGVASVEISFDNGTTWLPTLGAPETWSYLQTVDDIGPVYDDDGTYSYLVRAIDTYGSTGVENGQFTVDATPPVSTINLPADGATVNGQLTISGTAGDNISLSSAYYSIVPTPVFPGDYTLLAGSYSWSDSIDTTSLADSTFTLSIMAEDSAGNPSVVSTADFTVDQTSDRPVISFNSILEAGTFENNLLPSSKQIAGNITDDDSVDVSTIQYQLYAEDRTSLIDEDGSALPADTWTSISGAPGSDTTLATWTHTFGGTMTDGKYHIKLRAADTYDAGAFTGGGFGWDTSAMVEFAVDTANPETTISPANGGYTNQNFAVSGTATDDGGIKRVEIQFNAEAVIELYEDADLLAPFNTSQAWNTSYDIDTSTHGDDGVLNYVLTITDAYNKIKTYDRYVNVDTQVPVINSLTLVNNDAGTPAIVNGSVLIQGAPIDYEALINAIYIKTATAQPAEPGADPVAEGWTLLPSTTNIYHRFDTTILTDLTAYTTYIVLDDLAGNRTLVTDYDLPFTITQSGNTPVITMNTADASLLTSGGSISGSITDDDRVDVSTIEISIDGGAFIPVTSTSASDSTNVVFSHSLGAFSEQIASYSIEIRAFDIGEDFVDNTQDIAPVSSTSTAINIFVDDSDPTAVITQIDNGNDISPTIQGLYINDQFIITGTSADSVQVAAVRAKLSIDGAYALVTNTGTNFDTWTYSRSSLVLVGNSEVMNLEVEDIHGKITTYNYTLLVDTVDPSITLNTTASNPSTVSGAYNGTLTFTGTSTDNNQINTNYYLFHATIDPSTTDPVTDSWNTATGTYSWNFVLNTVNDATFGNNSADNSTVHLGVVSVDSAGNVSAVQNITFTINQGSDQPVLTVTQPADGGLIESNKKVIGSLSDDDGLASLQIRIDLTPLNGDFVDGETYVNISQPVTVSGVYISFEHDLSALGDGSYKIQLQAVDNDNASAFDTTTSSVISFDIDTLAPTLTLNQITVQNRYGEADTEITSNFNGSYVNNDSTLYFSASDSSGISTVEISTNNGTDWTSASVDLIVGSGIDADGNGDYSVLLTIPAGDLLDGTRNISYKATDARGKTTSKILTIIVDTVAPVIDFTQPTGVTTSILADAPNVNGDVNLRGSVSDSSSITSTTLVGGINTVDDPVTLTNTGNSISWISEIANSGTYANTTYAYNTGDNGGTTGTAWNGTIDGDEAATTIWRFPFEVTSKDFAGNITTTTGYVDIDPNSDNPIVSIVSPADGASVSGTFLVNGTITDDDGTDYVTLEFDFDDDGVYDGLGNLTVSGSPVNETTETQLTAPNGSWSIALNASDFTLAKLSTAGYTGNGFISLRMTPYDSNGLAGSTQTVRIYLDTTSPAISNLSPASGSMQKGTINLIARFEDDKQLLNSSMLISFDGGATFEQIADQAGYSITPSGAGPYIYDIDIPVDTTTAIAGGNGVMNIQLSVTDQTNKQQSESLSYNVDNNLPTIHWNEDDVGTLLDLPFIGTPPNEVYNFKGKESSGAGDDAYKVLGAAIDSGSISGISKVNVYFVKGGSFWSPIDGASTAVANSDIADDTGTPVSIPFTENSSYVITIDNRIEQGLFDQEGGIGDFDGFQESLKAKAGYDEWYSFFDTTQLPDGPIDIYAVAYDEAGNISYTVADAQIANNPPTIPTVVVGSTTIDDSTDKTKISGSVDFTLNLADAEGIDVSTIQLYITDRYTIVSGLPDTVDNGYTPPAAITSALFDSITPGTDSSVEVAVETVDTTAFTSGYYYRYVAEANDSDGNIVQRIFYIWVNNSDISAPTITIEDFDQSSVSGGNGHVDEKASSPNDAADADNLVDADLSGVVTVSGTAYDDSSISTLTVEYSLDAGANWTNAGTVAPLDLIVTGGDVLLGFDYSWTFDWDTSLISGVAEEDVLIRAYGTDGTNTTAEANPLPGDRPQVIADIVPYITDISGTGLESGLLAYVKRSATGRYPVVVGSTITIDGYNLPGTTTDGVSFGGTDLTASSATGNTQMIVPLVTVAKPDGILTSGDIVIVTNSVSSLNNTNDNTLPQNEEDNSYNANLSDNREAVFWDTTSLLGTSTVSDPFMHPNFGETNFDWMYVKSGKELYFLPGGSSPTEKKLTEGTGLKGGSFSYNSSGSLMYLFNHNAQWSFSDNSYRYTGGVQWGAIPNYANFTYSSATDAAYNWNHESGIPKVGLGNVSFGDQGGTLPNTVGSLDYGYSALDLNRYENLKIITAGDDTATRNYVAYFDSGALESRSIVFFAFKAGITQASVQGSVDLYAGDETSATKLDPSVTLTDGTNAATGIWYANIDKHFMVSETYSVVLQGNQDNNDNGIATPRGRQEVTTANTVDDSEYFDLAVFERAADTHWGFIVYFDENVQSLKLTSNTSLYNAEPTGTLGTWSAPVTIDTNAGAYVAMAVNPNPGYSSTVARIHIAYQDVASGYLKYAYYTFDGTSFTEVEEVFVDALFGAGSNNSIMVRDFGGADYRPVIVTYSSAFTGTRAPLRLSYPLFAPGTASFGAGASSTTGEFLGDWETVALPAISSPSNTPSFLYLDSNNDPYLGYEGSNLEEASFLGF